MLFHSPADLPDPVVTITGVHSGKAGGDLILTCKAEIKKYLIATPTVEWINNGSIMISSIVASGNGVKVDKTIHSGVTSMKRLTFSPLCTSHQANYTCKADINISSIGLKRTRNETANVVVQSK